MNNYEQRIKRVRDRGEIDITAEIVIETNRAELSQIFDLVSTVCDLLSIARCKKINWLYYDVFIDEEIVYKEHQPRIVTPYAGFEVIDHMPPENTVNFLQQCYPHYIALDGNFKFSAVTNIYTDAHSRGFIETKCLAAFSLIEYLAKKTTKPPTVLPKKRHLELWQWLEAIIEEYKVPIDSTNRGDYIKIRNSLIHDMKFTGNPQEQYFQALHFLDRLLL